MLPQSERFLTFCHAFVRSSGPAVIVGIDIGLNNAVGLSKMCFTSTSYVSRKRGASHRQKPSARHRQMKDYLADNDHQSTEGRSRKRREGERRKPMKLVYYVTPDPPPPPKFDPLVLGNAWTQPSKKTSKNSVVQQVLTTGKISSLPTVGNSLPTAGNTNGRRGQSG